MEGHEGLRHKGLGIASFVIAIVVSVLALLLFAIAGALTSTGKATPEINMVIGLFLVLVWFIDTVGVALGIAGAVDRTAKKTFPILWHRNWRSHVAAQCGPCRGRNRLEHSA